MAYAEVKGNERKESAVAFLLSALRHYRRLGIQVSGVMTDNARIFQSERFQRVLRWLGLKHKTTRPYTPRTSELLTAKAVSSSPNTLNLLPDALFAPSHAVKHGLRSA